MKVVKWIAIVVVIGVVAFIVFAFNPLGLWKEQKTATATAKYMPLKITLNLEGTLQPYEYKKIKVDMNYYKSELIIKFVVPNGTAVKKGQKILEFETTGIENEISRAKLDVETAQTNLTVAEEEEKKAGMDKELNMRDAKFKHDIAKKEYEKYIDIESPKMLAQHKMQIERAEAQLEEAKRNLETSKRLFKQDLVPEFEVKKAELALKEAEFALQNAIKEKELFEKHTDPIKRQQLENDVQETKKLVQERESYFNAILSQRKASVTNSKKALDEANEKLRKLEEDLKNTTVKAPADGIINHGSPERDFWYRAEEEELKEGAKVYPGATLMYIPELSRMYLQIFVDEADISKLLLEQIQEPAEEKIDEKELEKIDLASIMRNQEEMMNLAMQNPEAQKEVTEIFYKVFANLKPKQLKELENNPDKFLDILSEEDKKKLKLIAYKLLKKAKGAQNFRPLKALIHFEAYPDDSFTGRLEYVAGAASQATWYEETTKFKCRVEINGTRPWFRPGMKAKVELFVEEIPNALCIPVDAIFTKEGKNIVYVKKGNKFEPVEVKKGKSNNDFVQILSGIKEGDIVSLYEPVQK